MLRRFIVLLVGLSVAATVALAQPPNHVQAVAAAIVPASAGPGGPPPRRHLTAAAVREANVALKIRNYAQRGRTLNFRRAWHVTHNKTILRHYVSGVRSGGGHVTAAPRWAFAGSSCAGRNDFKQAWYGWRFRLDTCKTTRLEVLSASTAAIMAFIATVIPETPHTKVLLGVGELAFVIGAGGLAWCNAPGQGVNLYKYVWSPTAAWCTSQ
jgi:hypothetical protein